MIENLDKASPSKDIAKSVATDILPEGKAVIDTVENTVNATTNSLKSTFNGVTNGMTGVTTFCKNIVNNVKQDVVDDKKEYADRVNKAMELLNIQDTSQSAKQNGVNHEFF